ncbi:MAG: hypothetical protein L0G99_15220, partial [Propionibacteriales bacterium]|nr:hypothetical protein [Propionibacteriales bacterium]
NSYDVPNPAGAVGGAPSGRDYSPGAGTPDLPSASGAGLPSAASADGMPSGGMPGGGMPGGGMPGGGMPGGGAPGGGISGGGGDTKKWSIEDLATEEKLWQSLAQSHDKTVVADRILTQENAFGGILDGASRNIRTSIFQLERLASEATVAMNDIATLLGKTARSKSETESENARVANSTNGDSR